MALFTNEYREPTWININGGVSPFTSETSLPFIDDDPICLPNVGEVRVWHIYQEESSNLNGSQTITFPPCNRFSLTEIDALYKYISRRYTWCFFPWGSVGSFFGFGFISANKHLRDKFIDTLDNSNVPIKYSNTSDFYPICIASYDVESNFSSDIQCIIFDLAPDWLGMRIWQFAKAIAMHPPVLIYNNLKYSIREDLRKYRTLLAEKEVSSFDNDRILDNANNLELQDILDASDR